MPLTATGPDLASEVIKWVRQESPELGIVSAHVHRHRDRWMVQVNGRFVADTDTRREAHEFLAAVCLGVA